jgi:hypothetical protein
MKSPASPRVAPRLALAVAFVLTGCGTPRPRSEQWLAVGFRSPQQTFRSFQTALAADAPALEYRCLTSHFRRGANQLAYREVREQILRDQPWLRRAATAVVLSEQRSSADRARLIAEVDTWFGATRFEVDLVATGFAEIWQEQQLLWDETRVDRPLAQALEAPHRVRLDIALDPDSAFDPREATELRLGHEWRIDALRLVESD